VVREALTNVARHAQASSAQVSIAASTERIELCISDNGNGLDEVARRSGLDNLSTRAKKRRGTFTVESENGSGTVLRWIAPITTR
ncbi:MAG: sensor histidine kinase, partial [Marmoricola sp.]